MHRCSWLSICGGGGVALSIALKFYQKWCNSDGTKDRQQGEARLEDVAGTSRTFTVMTLPEDLMSIQSVPSLVGKIISRMASVKTFSCSLLLHQVGKVDFDLPCEGLFYLYTWLYIMHTASEICEDRCCYSWYSSWPAFSMYCPGFQWN